MIMKKENKYSMEQELMEAFTYAKTDADIGMPDIEAELMSVHQKAAKNVRQKSGYRQIVSIAASVVLALGLGWSIYTYVADANDGNDYCVAYVAGKRIADERQVMNLMTADIMKMNDGGDIIDCQLNDFFNE